MAISTPVSRAPVIRCSAMGCPPSSHTQMVSRAPISFALVSAASSTMHASSSVSRLTVIIPPFLSGDRSWQVHPDGLAVDAHGIGCDGGAAGWEETLTRPHVEHPAVPGTGEPRPGQLALVERTALVGARGRAGVHTLACAHQDHTGPVQFVERAAAHRELREGGRADLHQLVPDQLDFGILRSRSAAALNVHPRTPRAATSLGPRLARNLTRHSAGPREVWPRLVGVALDARRGRRPALRHISSLRTYAR